MLRAKDSRRLDKVKEKGESSWKGLKKTKSQVTGRPNRKLNFGMMGVGRIRVLAQ
jgi:hypothetical protein